MSTQRITRHKYVQFTYRIFDADSDELMEQIDMPVAYIQGFDGGLFLPIESALEGKTIGDEVEVILNPDQAFGEPDPELMYTDAIENVPPQFRQLGAEVEMQNEAGETKTFRVTHIEDGKLTVDGNNPLCGRRLRFVVKVLEVRDPLPGDRPGLVNETQGMLH